MSCDSDANCCVPRRDFIKLSAVALGALGGLGRIASAAPAPASCGDRDAGASASTRAPNTAYAGPHLSRVAFPMGGFGAGLICLEGSGAMSHLSLRNRPEVFNEPCAFSAIAIRGAKPLARVLEGPVPEWKLFGARGTARGAEGTSFGLPRCAAAKFTARFPFATVELSDESLPLAIELTGWSPFTPGDADSSSLPVAAAEYRFTNRSPETVAAVFSYSAKNPLIVPKSPRHAVRPASGGFTFWGAGAVENPWEEAGFTAAVDAPAVKVNHAWFRGGWWDPLTMAWREVESGMAVERPPVADDPPATGATLAVPFELAPGASRTIVLRLSWYAPRTNHRIGKDPDAPAGDATASDGETYQPWYAGRFADMAAVAAHWAASYAELRERSEQFAACFHDSTLPPEVLEAVAANLAILKSPTILRQTDGRIWAWEGCNDESGCCHGSCTHVWNYAQAIAHLFPDLERGMRETEFGPGQDDRGHQAFRVSLPIRPVVHDFHSAADGQLGGILKVHREWRISGDTGWLRSLWPKVRSSLDYCIETWDPAHQGWVEEPHHNTYDIEFWGPDGMCTSIYLGALQAAVRMGAALGDDVTTYATLLAAGVSRTERELFDGEYFFQKIEWKNLRARDPLTAQTFQGGYTPEARAILEQEGPKYQYGTGCLSDGVIGAWLARVCGVGQVLDPAKVASHLRAVFQHNFKATLAEHANPQRPSFAAGDEGGLLLCTWPKGGRLSLPFIYSNEVWTGIEYQVASHLMMMGEVESGRRIVRACRARYDGRVRNPFDEYECGHWYARALASYALLQALSGARYDAVDRVLHLTPALAGDFRCFLATATGYGTVGVRNGQPFLDVRAGRIDVQRIAYTPRA